MENTITYNPVYSWKFFKALWIHMRPYLLFVSGVAGLAGMAISSKEIDLPLFIIAFIPFFLGYGFGQALTDCFQIDTDSISAPYRPLVKKEISPVSLGTVSTSGLVAISFIIIYLNPYNILWCLLTIVGLATYTYFKKNFWFAGPFYNAWIVMLLPIIGFMAMNEGGYSILSETKLWQVCGLSFFSYANFVLIGYLKDISADKKTGYLTFPVKFGWDKSVWVGDVFLLLSILFSYALIDIRQPIAFGVFALASLVGISGQLFAHFTKNKTEINASYPIISTVRAFILWHLAVIVNERVEWLWFVIAFYVVFELVLYFRPEREQI